MKMPELKLLPTQEMIDDLEKAHKDCSDDVYISRAKIVVLERELSELKDAIIRYCAEYIEEISPDNEQDCIDYFLNEYKQD